MTETRAQEFLASVHLDPSRTATEHAADPRSAMPVTDIVFDPALLSGFDSLDGRGPADHVFGVYKSPGRNKDRNSLLWARVTKFVADERLKRRTGGVVKEVVKTTREQRELAQVMAAKGMTTEDLLALIADKEA